MVPNELEIFNNEMMKDIQIYLTNITSLQHLKKNVSSLLKLKEFFKIKNKFLFNPRI